MDLTTVAIAALLAGLVRLLTTKGNPLPPAGPNPPTPGLVNGPGSSVARPVTRETPAKTRHSSKRADIRWSGDMLMIDDELMFSAEKSPDGRLVVAATPELNGKGKWTGRAILIDGTSMDVIANVRCQAARYAHVADTGLFVVEDWGNPHEAALSSRVIVYDRTGSKLWTKSFKVAISQSSIAADGSAVTVETLNGDCVAQSSQRYVLDGTTGKVLERHAL